MNITVLQPINHPHNVINYISDWVKQDFQVFKIYTIFIITIQIMFKFKLLMLFNIHDMCKPQFVFKYNLQFLVNCVLWMNNELQQLVIVINYLINVTNHTFE